MTFSADPYTLKPLNGHLSSREPEPFCAECSASIGVFLRYGMDWRHYRGDGAAIGQIELFDPDHDPIVAWRLPSIPVTR